MSNPSFGAACKRPDVAATLKREIYTGSNHSKLPYPETVNLPFNRHALPIGFVLHPTPQTPSDAPGIWVFLQGNTVLMQEAGEQLCLPEGHCPDWLDITHQRLSFASLNDLPVRAVQVHSDQPLPPGLVEEPFNAFHERIPADLMSIAGLGKQILHWQRMSRFCSICGGNPVQLPESWGKRCSNCGTEHFPHIHPCAIVVIRRGDQLLLIHKPEWPIGRYSLVAGFLDMGESLEEPSLCCQPGVAIPFTDDGRICGRICQW